MIGFAERKLPVNRVMAASIVGLALALFLVGGFAGGYWMLVGEVRLWVSIRPANFSVRLSVVLPVAGWWARLEIPVH